MARASRLSERQVKTVKRKITNNKKSLLRLMWANIILTSGLWVYVSQFWTSEWFSSLMQYFQQLFG